MLSLVLAAVGFPPPVVPQGLGVNVHFTDPAPGEMARLAGPFRVSRMDFAWSATERAKGVYDFAAYDRLLAAMERAGVRPYWILDYGNDLYGEGSPRTPEARAAFCRWVAAAIARFRGHGILWEMWNEPNGGFWKPTANVDEYVLLARAVGETIRRVAPKETYVGPATSGFDWSFLQRCLDAGLLKYWDAVSVHPYRQTEPESVEADWLRLRTMLDRAAPGRNVPMLSGEWGYSELFQGQTKAKQGEYAVRAYLTNLRCGVPISVWYDWKDDGADPKEPEHHFGSVLPDLSPKPTYDALSGLAKELAGYAFVTRLYTKDDRQWILLFRKGSEARLAAWTTGASSKVRLPGTTSFESGIGPRVVTLGSSPILLTGSDLTPLLGWKSRPWATISDDVGAVLSGGVGVVERAFGEAIFTQRTYEITRRPLALSVFPGREGGTYVHVDNPYRRDLTSFRVGFAPRRASIVRLESGTPASSGDVTVPAGMTLVGLRGESSLIGLDRPIPRFVDIPLNGATATTDGDTKVVGKAEAAATPEGLRFAYDADPGWRFAELHPKDGAVAGRPMAFGIWVRGDDSGATLLMRYVDATGQTFQPDGGPVDGSWRFVSFPLDGTGGHWGGANDGTVHFPIRLATIALLEIPGHRGGHAAVTLARPTLAYAR